jgi:proteasome accessory factor B
MSTFDDRGGTKWDRAARYLRIAQVLHAHGEAGISAAALARQVGVSRRTIYRDLEGIDLDGGLPIWNEGGRFGLEAGAFLPPLALTLPEAMALFLAARLLTKATDELDPELIGALVKLAEVLPDVLAEQLHETATAFSDSTPRDEAFTRVLRGLTQALAERRVVEIVYAAGTYDRSRADRRLRLRPYAIEPSGQTRALYVIGFDEERQARRTFKVERIRSVVVTPDRFESQPASVAEEMRSAWDVIGDDEPVRIVVRFGVDVASRVAETRWHPSQVLEPSDDGSLIWRARVSGVLEIRAWLLGWGADAEVLEPPELRAWVAAQHRDAAGLYS